MKPWKTFRKETPKRKISTDSVQIDRTIYSEIQTDACGLKLLLGESWSQDELMDAKIVMSCIYEGVDCPLPVERMLELERRGLVTNIKAKRGRGRYANRFEFEWCDKLELLVKADKQQREARKKRKTK